MKTVVAGAAFGMAAAAITARLIVSVVPELAGEAMLAVAESIPFGLVVGFLMGGFLSARGRRVSTFRRVLLETIGIAIVAAIIVGQLVLPVASKLPRVTIATLIVVFAAALAGIGAWLLRPLYWRPPGSIAD
jgi:hypothetical protein